MEGSRGPLRLSPLLASRDGLLGLVGVPAELSQAPEAGGARFFSQIEVLEGRRTSLRTSLGQHLLCSFGICSALERLSKGMAENGTRATPGTRTI